MGVNRVDLANGENLIDLSQDTINPDVVLEGYTGHNAQGEPFVGRAISGSGGYEPFYIDCTFNQNGNIFSAVATSDTPTQSDVDAAFAEKRPIYLRWEAAGIYLLCTARTYVESVGYIYTFLTIDGGTISTMQFMNGGFYNTYFVAQEKIAVVNDESAVEDGKITIVV